MTTKVSVVLYTSKTLKNGEHPIMIRLTKDRKSTYIASGYKSMIEQWDLKRQIPRRNYPNKERLLQILDRHKTALRDIIFEFEAKGTPFSLSSIKQKYSGQTGKKKVGEYFTEISDRLVKSGHAGNGRMYRETSRVFKAFCKNKDFFFEELTYGKLKSFQEYMEFKGQKVNTIALRLRTLRALYNLAINEEIVDERYYPFKKFKIKTEKTRNRALDRQEIKLIEEFEPTDPQMEWAKKLFLFSYYCQGMSFKDMAFLKREDIYKGRIYYQRAKTGRQYDIKVHSKLVPLVNEFKKASEGTYLVPFRSDLDVRTFDGYRSALSWFNKLLKRMGKELELSLHLSSYVSRHSYATIARQKGMAVGIISQALGHTNERTTQIYLDSFENVVMDKANEEIFA
jgi:integrase